MSDNMLFKLENLAKDYKMGEVTVNALKAATFNIEKGEFVVVLRPSGPGKSTLLNILGGMDTATAGSIYF